MSALPREVKYMPVPKSNQRAVNKYKKNNYDRIEITVPKGQRDIFQAHAAARGESTNAFIGRAIQETMERDTGGHQEATGAALGPVVSLTPEAIKTAQEAAEAAGEFLPQFITRAIESRAALDKRKKPIDKGGQ